jgi:3-phosphoshikimate 1-carboxyvinyltransferase
MSTLKIIGESSFSYGAVRLPASKSLTNRALIIQALTGSSLELRHLSLSDDSRNLLECLQFSNHHLNVGAAGTNMRFLVSLLSILPGEYILSGNDRLNERPISQLAESLLALGANISYIEKKGYPPLKIIGGILDGGEVEIDGHVSSQFISSLLMIAPCLKKGLKIKILNTIVSKPYIEMTIGLMKHFGVEVKWNDSIIEIPPQKYIPKPYTVEPDWSAAAFWYGLLAVSKKGNKILLNGLSFNSLQGDRHCAGYYEGLGVQSKETPEGIVIEKTSDPVNHIQLNLLNEPDLFPALAFSCAALRIPASFSGLQTLNQKESKRIDTIKNELEKTGAVCTAGNDFFEMKSYYTFPDRLDFNTYGDHRIAMASSIFYTTGMPIFIHDPEVVSKSYPGFWEDLKNTGIVNIY